MYCGRVVQESDCDGFVDRRGTNALRDASNVHDELEGKSMKHTNPNGFTLIELLVVSVILTLLSVVIAQVFFSTMRTNSKTETVRDVKSDGDRAIDIMSRLVQNAKSIQLPASCPEGSPGAVFNTLTLINFDGGVTTLLCADDTSTGISRIASASASQTVYLTSELVSVFDTVDVINSCTNHALSFTCSSVGTTPSYVTIHFTLHQANSQASVTDSSTGSFQTTVSIRNK